MQKQVYQVGDEVVTTLKEVGEILGVGKVKLEDVAEGGKYSDVVTLLDAEEDEGSIEEPTEPSNEDMSESEPDTEPDSEPGDTIKETDDEGDDVEDTGDDEEDWDSPQRVELEGEQLLSPEEMAQNMPEFETLDELKEFIKDIDTDTLIYIAKSLGLEWKPTDHAQIERMRVAMSLHGHYFPELVKPKGEDKKKKAKYGDFDNPTLFKMAKDHGVRWKRSGNDPIDRMRVIMALKKAEVLPE